MSLLGILMIAGYCYIACDMMKMIKERQDNHQRGDK